MKTGLTADELERYESEGFLVFEALINGEKLAYYKAVFDELVERARAMNESTGHFNLQPDRDGKPIAGRLFKLQGVCAEDPRVLELAREPAIVDRVESLAGPDLHVFGTKFFPMIHRGGTSVGWHQDNHYFGTNSNRVVTCGIYLEDTDRENGCLQLIPRSHRSGHLVEHVFGTGEYAHGSWADVDESQAIDVECPGGTVLLFSANLLHSARQNHSDRTRYSTAWHYIPPDMLLEQFPPESYNDRHIVRGCNT